MEEKILSQLKWQAQYVNYLVKQILIRSLFVNAKSTDYGP
jgi:hypothetical protein